MLKKIIAIVTIFSAAILVLLLNISTPANAGPFGILVLFICSYFVSVGVMTYLIFLFSGLVTRSSALFGIKRPIEALSFRFSYYYSTIIGAAPIMLIGLQSVGAVGVYEFLLVAVFTVIGCLYITKRIQ